MNNIRKVSKSYAILWQLDFTLLTEDNTTIRFFERYAFANKLFLEIPGIYNKNRKHYFLNAIFYTDIAQKVRCKEFPATELHYFHPTRSCVLCFIKNKKK